MRYLAGSGRYRSARLGCSGRCGGTQRLRSRVALEEGHSSGDAACSIASLLLLPDRLRPGRHEIPITPSGPVPSCKDLPAEYGYDLASMLCGGVADKEFAGARLAPAPWDCKIGDGIATNGVLCRW